MALALLFSGQGMQHARMLPWLPHDHPLLLDMQRGLRIDNWRAALRDADWAAANEHAQAVLTATALAGWDMLASHVPDGGLCVVAGYSVGELAAASVAGVFDPPTAVRLARQRAQAMDAAAAGQDFGMLAISGAPLARIQAWCECCGVELAIHNGPDSGVSAGPPSGLRALRNLAVAEGGHCTPLSVRIASHTRWMRPATERFKEQLSGETLADPLIAWPCNIGQLVWSHAGAAQALADQISNPVQWMDCMEMVHERRPSAVLEIGPGRSLAAMWNRRFPDIPVRSADEFQSLAALARWLRRFVQQA